MLLGAVLSMTLVAAAPALAQVAEQEFSERRITSGKASPSFSVSNKGDNANLCPTGQQATQTGNVANEQGVAVGPKGEAKAGSAEAKAGSAEAKAGGGGGSGGGGQLPKTGGVAGTA